MYIPNDSLEIICIILVKYIFEFVFLKSIDIKISTANAHIINFGALNNSFTYSN